MIAGLIAIACGMGLVRLGWGARRAWAIGGWMLAGLGLIGLAMRDGAWGLAIGTLAGTAAAIGCVLWAGWTSPVKTRRPSREPPSIDLPRRWAGFGRRVTVFLLTVPVAFAAAQWCAFGAQALARRSGMGETNAVVLLLFLQPVLWMTIMAIQMTRSGPARMIAAPAAAAVLGTTLWGLS